MHLNFFAHICIYMHTCMSGISSIVYSIIFFPDTVSAFINKVFILITKFLLNIGRWGALVHGLTFFIV